MFRHRWHHCAKVVLTHLHRAIGAVRLRDIGPVPILALPGAVESTATHAPFLQFLYSMQMTQRPIIELEYGNISGVLETQ